LEKSKNVPTSRSRFDSGNSDASCATDLYLFLNIFTGHLFQFLFMRALGIPPPPKIT